jgi:hypothetical protein
MGNQFWPRQISSFLKKKFQHESKPTIYQMGRTLTTVSGVLQEQLLVVDDCSAVILENGLVGDVDSMDVSVWRCDLNMSWIHCLHALSKMSSDVQGQI